MTELLRLRGLSVGYGHRAIVHGIDAALNEGESLLVIGHNGAGKSTLLRTLFGLQASLCGRIQVLGREVYEGVTPELVRSGVRYLAQGPRYFGEMSIEEHRLVLGRLYGFGKLPQLPAAVPGLRNVKGLSVGQRRLEALYLLRGGSPKLCLFDEPTAGVDLKHTEEILHWISSMQQRGVGFVIADHNLNSMFEICSITMVIRSGQVTYIGPSQDLRNPGMLARFFI